MGKRKRKRIPLARFRLDGSRRTARRLAIEIPKEHSEKILTTIPYRFSCRSFYLRSSRRRVDRFLNCILLLRIIAAAMLYNNWKRWHQAQNGSAGNGPVAGLANLLRDGTPAKTLTKLRSEEGTVWLALHPEGSIVFIHHVHTYGGRGSIRTP